MSNVDHHDAVLMPVSKPAPIRKCLDCDGDGLLPIFSMRNGREICTIECPICRG